MVCRASPWDRLLGVFAFDLAGRTAYLYSLATLFLLFLLARRLVALAVRPVAAGDPRQPAARRLPSACRSSRRLVAIYTIAAVYAGIAGRAAGADDAFVSLDVLEFHRSADVLLVLVIGGTGYLYGGIVGALVFKLLQDVIAGITPQYWQFWIGLLLVRPRARRA